MSDNNQKMSYVELDGKDLPAFCPNPTMPIWSSHPRVYIDLGNRGADRTGGFAVALRNVSSGSQRPGSSTM